MRLLMRRQDCADQRDSHTFQSMPGPAIELRRRRELEQAWLETLAGLPWPVVLSPERQQQFLEALLVVDALLDVLPAQVRNAFLWARLGGLTCPQIAARLGVSPAAVEGYVAAALRHCYTLRFGQERREYVP